ncbi:MAG: OmpW family outer membrane protein [Candidatus Fermentibacter sp.]|nr:OmpW family outer membrane protein [Candidatus Fermentibacter sp.]
MPVVILALLASVDPYGPWTVGTSLCIDGVESEASQADGIEAFSAVYVRASVSRALSRILSASLSVANASHEFAHGEDEIPMGSVEFLPVTAMLQYRPLPGRGFEPRIGAGACAVVFWEKSGSLDSLDLPACVSPAIELGLDWNLSQRLLLGLGARWTWLDTGIENGGERLTDLSMDVLELSLGIGTRL